MAMETVFCSNCKAEYQREVLRNPSEQRPIILKHDYCVACGLHGLSTAEFLDHDIQTDIREISKPEDSDVTL